MPLYRFQITSSLPVQVVLERVGGLVRAAPGFWQSLKESFGARPERTPPFIGKLEGNEFRIHRDIRYRNSFLPRIYGQVAESPRGTEINVAMSLDPVVTAFMVLWFGMIGFAGVAALANANVKFALIPLGMAIFGVALTLGGFFPEALKARRLLEQNLGSVGTSV